MNYEAVVIGVSSGGLNALKGIFSSLPFEFPLPIVVVQHVGARSDSVWIELINKTSALNIKEADEKELLKPGNIYIAPPNYHLLIEKDKTLSLSSEQRVNYARPSIDVLFESAADAYKEKLIGIVLTGASHDGSAGIKRIKKNGGLAIVEDPKTAESPFMPASAIAAITPDYVVSLSEMPALLIKISASQTTV